MPSPIGHALGGIAAGWWLTRRGLTPRGLTPGGLTPRGLTPWGQTPVGRLHTPGTAGARAAWLAAIGAAADMDLLAGAHRGVSHSLGAALLVGIVVAVATRNGRWSAAASLAWGSHVLLDWLGEDTWPPIGVEALWPLTGRFFQAPFVVFPSVSRQYWRDDFLYYNARALGVELLILLPLALAVIAASGGRPFPVYRRSGPAPPRA